MPLQLPYQSVFDTSALFDLKKNYPPKIFPGLWQKFDELCHDTLIIFPREVLVEIKQGNDELIEWADRHHKNFLEPVEEELNLVQSLLEKYPQQIIEKYSFGAWADPFVIASAKRYGLTIVQQETNDANQYKIPPMAGLLGIKCIRLVEFFEEQGWEF